MFGLNFEMVKGLLERYGASGAILLVTLGFLPADWTSASCVTASGVPISTTQIIIIGGVLLAQTAFGVKLNTQSSLVQAAASMPDVKKVVVNENMDAAKLSGPEAKVTQS